MSRWAVTGVLMLGAPFVFVGEVQALCALLDAQMDPIGKVMTIFGGGTISLFIFIGRHG